MPCIYYRKVDLMRTATAQEISEQQEVMTAAWKFLKKYYWISENEIEWENLIEESSEFQRKYNSSFSKSIIVAVIEEIDRSYKKRTEVH